MMQLRFILTSALAFHANAQLVEEEEFCRGACTTDNDGNKMCRFTTHVNYFQSEFGYYSFVECGEDVTNPVLGMEVDVTYIFDQSHYSNWYNPLGFSYYPDGSHFFLDELDPVNAPPGVEGMCTEDATCPAPMYIVARMYTGLFSNIPELMDKSANETDYGLDVYEPLFTLPLLNWLEKNEYSVQLKIDPDSQPIQDIFYHSRTKKFMTGRIKIVDATGLLYEEDIPEISYPSAKVDPYDEQCGTYNISNFQLPNEMCPETFVCNIGNKYNFRKFATCINSINCAMLIGMTTGISSGSELALFLHQIIPNTKSMVNTAKALLKTKSLVCPDLTYDTDDCIMLRLCYSIINEQNDQVQKMQAMLTAKAFPDNDQCFFRTDEDGNVETVTSAGQNSSLYMLVLAYMVGLFAVM